MSELFEKWPPLKGTPSFKPDGLFDINWALLQDAYSEAEYTPYYLLGLTSDNEGDVQNAVYGLYAATTHQGSVYTASQAAIPFLVDLVGADIENAATFLSRIAIGENHWVKSPLQKGQTNSIYFNDVAAFFPMLRDIYKKTDCVHLERLLAIASDIDLNIDFESPLESESQIIRFAEKLVAIGFLKKISNQQAEKIKAYTDHQAFIIKFAARLCLAFHKKITSNDLNWLIEIRATSNDVGVEKVDIDLAHTSFERVLCKWVWGDDLIDMAVDAFAMNASDDEIFTQTMISVESRRDILLQRHFTDASFLYHPDHLSDTQRRILNFIVDNSDTPTFAQETYGLPRDKDAIARLSGRRQDAFTIRVDHHGYPTPIWYLISCYLYGQGDENGIVKILRKMPQLWSKLDDIILGNHDRTNLQMPNFFDDLVNKDGHDKNLAKLMSCFALAVKDDLDHIESYLRGWLAKLGRLNKNQDWGHKTESFKIGIGLLALARFGKLTSEFYPLIRPYHSFAEYSRIPLFVIAEIMQYTDENKQREIFDTWCKDLCSFENADEDYDDDEGEPFAPFVQFDKSAWILLTGCKGQWVTKAIFDVAEKCEKLRAAQENLTIESPPYDLMHQCAKQQPVIDVASLAAIARL